MLIDRGRFQARMPHPTLRQRRWDILLSSGNAEAMAQPLWRRLRT
jgi:hypothetical protein